MANLLTNAEVREHIETGLVDGALDRLNDDADASAIRELGPLDTDSQEFLVVDTYGYPSGRDKFLILTRSPGVITSITEQLFDNNPVVLSPDDYSLDGNRIERLNTGTNPRTLWGHRVTVVFTPQDTTETRKIIVIDLIKLEVEYRGLAEEKAGDYKMTAPEYEKARQAIFRKLKSAYSFA